MNDQNSIIEIASTHLGKVGGAGYKDQYDPTLLVPIPRYYNRRAYGIDSANLPFIGGDAWNAYEVSCITDRGLPIIGMLKLYYSADSEFHIESKSIKLYLNSFNMTKMGNSTEECSRNFIKVVEKDLSEKLETAVKAYLFLTEPSQEFNFRYPRIQDLTYLEELEFTSYKSDENQLEDSLLQGVLQVDIDFLRSNCRVTNQPDFGNIYIHMKSDRLPTLESLAKYVVSHRQVSHFHEEIAEMTFMHLLNKFNPEKMMVACLYSRRGGIDINPIRATHQDLIPEWFTDPSSKIKKTLKQ
jgi:7-cyano-7-deazaguanine reductase